MKTLLSFLAAVAVSVLGALVHAADPVAPLIEVTVDYLQLSAEDAGELLHGDDAPTSGKAWHDALIRLVKGGKGKVVASISVTTKSGLRGISESVLEHIYPTEFAPPKGREHHSPPVPAGLTAVDLPVAASFEMRPVGLRLEVDPALSADATLVDLNLAPELLLHIGDEVMLKLPHESGERELQKMPRFYTMKTATAVSLRPGGSAFCGMNTPSNADGTPNHDLRLLCLATVRLVAP
jgi:hypothetical protein